jgi:hypothetical protein
MTLTSPIRALPEIGRASPVLNRRAEIEAALDELNSLSKEVPPEVREYAEPVIAWLRAKLAATKD